MREMVVAEASRLGISVELEEIGDMASLSKINPLSLPRLYLGDDLVASQNPPKISELSQAMINKLMDRIAI